MAEPSTIGKLFKAKAVIDDQVAAAVDAYLADDSTGAFEIAPGCKVNLAEAIERPVPANQAPTERAAEAVPAALEQAKRYARAIRLPPEASTPDAPFAYGLDEGFFAEG